MAESAKTQVITANRLADGLVVYLARDGGWSRRLADGWVSRDEAEAVRLNELAADAQKRCLVVGPYPIDVTVEGGAVKPVRLREAIRAEGPTVGAAQPSPPARQAAD
jgi:hypothetical protein